MKREKDFHSTQMVYGTQEGENFVCFEKYETDNKNRTRRDFAKDEDTYGS